MKNYEKSFWNRYMVLLTEQKVPDKFKQWYLRWIKNYLKSLNNYPVERCSKETVQKYLDGLSSRGSYEHRQIVQADDALRILYQKMLVLDWAQPWPIDVQQPDTAVALKSSTFSDSCALSQVIAVHPEFCSSVRIHIS
jgi:hypothetical protein